MALSPSNAAQDDRVTYVLDAVAHPDRRRLLETLSEFTEERVAVDALVGETTPDATDTDDAFDYATRHVHLPKLAELGVIDYRPAEGWVLYRRARVVDVLVTAARAFAERDDGGER